MRQAPRSQRGQDDNEEQEDGHRAEERSVLPTFVFGKRAHSLHQSALRRKDGGDDGDDTDEHNEALNKVVDRGGHISAGNNVHAGKNGHNTNDDDVGEVFVGEAERHREQSAETVKKRGGVRDQEDKDDDGRSDLKARRIESFTEEVGHGLGIEVLGHDARSAAEYHPGKKTAEDGVTDTDPGAGHAEQISELSRVPNKDNGRKVRRTVRKSGQPRAYRTSAEDESVYVGRLTTAINTDGDHRAEKDGDHNDL